MPIQSINPATEEVVASFEEHAEPEVDAAMATAYEAFRALRRQSFAERARALGRMAAELHRRRSELAGLVTLEMGKPIVEAEAEIDKCAWCCSYFAEHAGRFLAPQRVATDATQSYVVFDPLGVVLAVMPWNFPFWQVFRFLAPALMAGNAAVLKHASNVPQCALAIEEVVNAAGLPRGALRTLLVSGARVDGLIGDRRVAAVTLTGSTEVGEKVASVAGRHLKKQVLELGGSDPFIVLADADLDAAAAAGSRARNQNAGQSCIAAKRFIVADAVADAFTRKLVAAVETLPVGDPSRRETRVGPLARGDLRDVLDRQVQASLAAGASLALGGRRLVGRGYFYAPTVLSEVTADMAAFREETFGPVAAVLRARDAQEAVRLANASAFGLGAALWTRDVGSARELARDIEAGAVFINGVTASDPRLPFGGVKKSGYGRELGEHGIREFTNVKSVWIGPGRPAEQHPDSE